MASSTTTVTVMVDMKNYSDILDDLLDAEDGLRDKDIEFIESCASQRDALKAKGQMWQPSDRQAQWLDDLYERHC